MMVGKPEGREKFELRRQSDGLVYTFKRDQFDGGKAAYRRQDQDVWIISVARNGAGLPGIRQTAHASQDHGMRFHISNLTIPRKAIG
jgi:hypothetical protein